MFIVQPNSSFGDLICKELTLEEGGQRKWQIMEIAVAWVNRLGAERIEESARWFLTNDGRIRATVGLDFSSTSYEGLCTLLDLENHGDIVTHVFYDENSACTFHPKIFLFNNAERALLLVGSNNMTGAGLDANVEAALGIEVSSDSEIILEVDRTLKDWRDEESDARTRRLTRELLELLRERGYVRTEEEIRDRRRSDAASRSSKEEPLFGRSATPTRKRRRGERGREAGLGRTASDGTGEVLLMRVKPRRDGKQLQISLKVHESTFMKGAKRVILTDGSPREIGYNMARGKPNTARFEAPEMQEMATPVARFRWVSVERPEGGVDKVLQCELFDADNSRVGAEIFQKLKDGITSPPVTNLTFLGREVTVLSKSDQDHSQWYRLDSI